MFLVVAALLALRAVRTLDLSVYHRMLRGAVTFGEDFEQQYMKKIFTLDKGMTEAISHYSRFGDAGYDRTGTGGYKYTGKVRKSAEQKIAQFYRSTSWFLVIAAVVLLGLTNARAAIEWCQTPEVAAEVVDGNG